MRTHVNRTDLGRDGKQTSRAIVRKTQESGHGRPNYHHNKHNNLAKSRRPENETLHPQVGQRGKVCMMVCK